MITCFIKYIIDPYQIAEFELYGKKWIDLVNEMGGIHHGYLLPFEGSNNVGYASFSYPSLAAYEEYRIALSESEKCQDVLKDADNKKFIISYERSFMKPVFSGLQPKHV